MAERTARHDDVCIVAGTRAAPSRRAPQQGKAASLKRAADDDCGSMRASWRMIDRDFIHA